MPPLTNGMPGTTTRYWDCCKPSGAWNGGSLSCDKSNNPISDKLAGSSCNGGNAFTCYDLSPWAVSPTLAYGFAARASSVYTCGACYQIDFKGGALANKSMIVQVINNGGDVGANQFDLLIPGGGVGAYNACSSQWGTSDLGAQYGGFLYSCSTVPNAASCVAQKCQSVFAGKPDLLAGCNWFTTWFSASNNPSMVYAQVPCPADITAKSGF